MIITQQVRSAKSWYWTFNMIEYQNYIILMLQKLPVCIQDQVLLQAQGLLGIYVPVEIAE